MHNTIIEKIADYKWSSYNACITKDPLINSTFALGEES